MQVGLYYPHWSISNAEFLFGSLLTWDHFQCIVPYRDFNPLPMHPDREVAMLLCEAHEQWVEGHAPSPSEKARAHQYIQQICAYPCPPGLKPDMVDPQYAYYIDAQKLLPNTWVQLTESGWVRETGRFFGAFPEVGFLIMHALVRACSSPVIPPVTDQDDAFQFANNLVLSATGASSFFEEPTDGFSDKDDLADERTRAIKRIYLTSTGRLNLGRPSVRQFRRILEIRRDPDMEGLRRAYTATNARYVEAIKGSKTSAEVAAWTREYHHELESDGLALIRELKRAAVDAVFSKDGAIALSISVAGAFTGYAELGVAFSLGMALRAHRGYRRAVLDKHWTSYLYQARNDRFSLW